MVQTIPARPKLHSLAPDLAAYVTSDAGRQAAAQLMGPVPPESIRSGGLALALRLVGTPNLGRRLIVELDTALPDETMAGLRELAETAEQVVVLGHADRVEVYRRVRAAGASEYFPLPLPPDASLVAPGAAAEPARAGRGLAIGVCGVVGGTGASLLAANLAWALSPGLSPSSGARGCSYPTR